ncbi:hypothetical protein B0H14DRAFT_2592450 [Mycena olivaceomarginata]|nr:hypothetical protein B0H14DRAFT_2592450 [Mycena olivaceomarginata]
MLQTPSLNLSSSRKSSSPSIPPSFWLFQVLKILVTHLKPTGLVHLLPPATSGPSCDHRLWEGMCESGNGAFWSPSRNMPHPPRSLSPSSPSATRIWPSRPRHIERHEERRAGPALRGRSSLSLPGAAFRSSGGRVSIHWVALVAHCYRVLPKATRSYQPMWAGYRRLPDFGVRLSRATKRGTWRWGYGNYFSYQALRILLVFS